MLAALPLLPGVYRFYGEQEKVLYIGKAKNLKRRVSSYFQKNNSPRIRLMLQAAQSFDTIVTDSENEALLLENNLIKSLKPKYNILFRDDKSYPYLRLTRHAYPRLTFYRGAVKEDADYFGPFPDSRAVRETIDILQRTFRLRTCDDSMLSTRSRPCLLHSIGRCSAPCTNKIPPDVYAADAAQARRLMQGKGSAVEVDIQNNMMRAAREERFEAAALLRDRLQSLAVVRGRHFADNVGAAAAAGSNADYVGVYSDGLNACVNIIMVRGGRRVGERRLFPANAVKNDAETVAEAFLSQYYAAASASGAAPLPDKIYVQPLPPPQQRMFNFPAGVLVTRNRAESALRLAAAVQNARLALINKSTRYAARQQQLQELARHLALDEPPRQIECFDVSHHMGEETFASRIMFINGAAEKSGYRLYRIKQATGGDDYAALAEAVQRCYSRAVRENTPLPDLLLIDGGVGQMRAVLKAFAQIELAPPPLFAVAKGAARRPGEETLISADGERLQLPSTNRALHLIQAARDEAHRFAITAHRRGRDKKRAAPMALDNIEGIGEERRRMLMTYFGGLPALRAAGVSSLVKINGIGPELAKRIYKALNS